MKWCTLPKQVSKFATKICVELAPGHENYQLYPRLTNLLKLFLLGRNKLAHSTLKNTCALGYQLCVKLEACTAKMSYSGWLLSCQLGPYTLAYDGKKLKLFSFRFLITSCPRAFFSLISLFLNLAWCYKPFLLVNYTLDQ
jgi:hypothetical protein